MTTMTTAAQELVWRDEASLLSQDQQEERQRHREEVLKSIVLKEEVMDFVDERLTCPRGCVTEPSKPVRYSILRDSWALPRCGGCMGHMRKDTGKLILAECPKCKERWQEEGLL